MSDKQEQNSPKVVLIVGLIGLAQYLAADLELAAASADEDPIEHANRLIAGLVPGAEAAAAAQEDLALIEAGLSAHGFAVVEGTSAPEKMAEALAALRARDGQLQEVNGELAGLKRQLSAQKGQVTKARAAQAVAEASAPASARPIGRTTSKFAGKELLELIQGSETVELAFSDGSGEIVDLKPRTIASDCFELLGSGGVRLKVPELRVFGARPGEEAYRLAGYGLLVDGELVAWSDRGDVLTIAPGTQVELKDDVVF